MGKANADEICSKDLCAVKVEITGTGMKEAWEEALANLCIIGLLFLERALKDPLYKGDFGIGSPCPIRGSTPSSADMLAASHYATSLEAVAHVVKNSLLALKYHGTCILSVGAPKK